MNDYHLKRSEYYLGQLEGKAFFMHLALYAIAHALLAIAEAIREVRDEQTR